MSRESEDLIISHGNSTGKLLTRMREFVSFGEVYLYVWTRFCACVCVLTTNLKYTMRSVYQSKSPFLSNHRPSLVAPPITHYKVIG